MRAADVCQGPQAVPGEYLCVKSIMLSGLSSWSLIAYSGLLVNCVIEAG